MQAYDLKAGSLGTIIPGDKDNLKQLLEEL